MGVSQFYIPISPKLQCGTQKRIPCVPHTYYSTLLLTLRMTEISCTPGSERRFSNSSM